MVVVCVGGGGGECVWGRVSVCVGRVCVGGGGGDA